MTNWTKNRLIDVAEIVMGQSPNSSFYNSENVGMPFLQGCAEFGKTYPNTQVSTSQIKKIGKQNSILFSVRAPVGKVNWADTDYCIGRGLSAIRGTKVEQNYLYQYFLYLKERSGFSSQGSTFDSINFDELSKVEIQSPEEKPEQARIAEILSTADEAIVQTEALIAKYQRIKTGLMQDLLTRGIDAHGNIRRRATHKFVVKNGIEVPEEWEVVRFEECYKDPIRDFGSFSSTKLIDFLEEGIPFIKSEMIEIGHIKWDKVTYISKEVHELLSKSHVKKGNILFSKIGSALGKAVVYENEFVSNSNAAIAKIDLDPQKADNYFICYFLNYDFAQYQFQNMIVSLLPRINLGDINNLNVMLPSIEEQKKIAKILQSIDENIAKQNDHQSKLHSLKIGLMQDLLSGRVRVKVKE